MKRTKTFDSRCYDLAEYFYPNAPEAKLDDLASLIQDLVESWGEDSSVEEESLHE